MAAEPFDTLRINTIEGSIHPEHILKNKNGETPNFSCEGRVLHLHYENETQLAKQHVHSFSNDYLPAQDRYQVNQF